MPSSNEALAMADSTNQVMDELVSATTPEADRRYTRTQFRTRTHAARNSNMSALVSALNLEPAAVPQATLKRALSLERKKVTSNAVSAHTHLASRLSDADNFEDGGLDHAADAAEIITARPQSLSSTDQRIEGLPTTSTHTQQASSSDDLSYLRPFEMPPWLMFDYSPFVSYRTQAEANGERTTLHLNSVTEPSTGHRRNHRVVHTLEELWAIEINEYVNRSIPVPRSQLLRNHVSKRIFMCFHCGNFLVSELCYLHHCKSCVGSSVGLLLRYFQMQKISWPYDESFQWIDCDVCDQQRLISGNLRMKAIRISIVAVMRWLRLLTLCIKKVGRRAAIVQTSKALSSGEADFSQLSRCIQFL